MKFKPRPEECHPRRSSLSYLAGGLIPLGIHTALAASVAVTLVALLVFGHVKGHYTTQRPWRRAWQTAVVGALAAAAAFGIAKLVERGA